MCDNEGVIISDKLLLDDNSHTFISDAHHSTSWIDHCLSTVSSHCLIKEARVIDKYVYSDHLPLQIIVNSSHEINNSVSNTTNNLDVNNVHTNWSSFNELEIDKYKKCTEIMLRGISSELKTGFDCNVKNCTDKQHRQHITNVYDTIISTLTKATPSNLVKNCQPVSNGNKLYKHVIGWNDICKEAHNIAREYYLIWVSYDKLRQGHIFNNINYPNTGLNMLYAFVKKKKIPQKLTNSMKNYHKKTTSAFGNLFRKPTTKRFQVLQM